MRSGKYATAQGDVLGRVAAMDTAAVELKLLDLAKLVRTAQECQHQSDVLHGLKEDQLAAGIEVLQVQLQQIQRAVWSHDGVVASGAGGSGSALRGSGLSSSDLLLARRTELQSLESRLQALEAGVARDAKAAEEAVAARDQVERMLLERVIALEGSVAGGRAVRSAWAEQQDIRQLRRELADLTSGVAGALSCLGLQPWLGTASEEAADAEAGGGGAAADADAKAAALGQGQGQGPSAAVAGQRLQMAAEQGYGLARVGGAAAAPVPPATEAVGEGADRTVRRSSALQALPPVLQEAMDRTAHAAAAAAVEASEARVAVQREADAARVRALAGVVQSLGGAQRALAGQVEQLAELCPRLLEALQHARQHPASAGAFTTASAAAGGGGGRDAQLEEAYMLAAEAGSLMVGMKKALAEAMVLGTAGAASYSEQLDAAVAGDATLQPMLEEAKVLRGRLAMAAATVPAPSDATTTAAAAAGAKQPSPGLGAQGDLRDTTNTLHGHHDAHTESAKGVVRMSGGNSCAGATRQSPTRQQPPDAPAAAHVVPSALHGSDGSHPGPNHQSPHGAASASSAVSVVSLADLARPHFAGGAAQLAGPNQLPTPWHQQEQEQQPRTSRLPYVYPYREQDATEGCAANIQTCPPNQRPLQHPAAPLATPYAAGDDGDCGPRAQLSGNAEPLASTGGHAVSAAAGGWEGGMRTLALSAALAAQMQAALQGLSSTASLLHAGTAAAAGALCGTAAGADSAAAVDAARLPAPSALNLDAPGQLPDWTWRREASLVQAAEAPIASSPPASSCDSQYSPRSGRSMARLRRQHQQAGVGGTARATRSTPAGGCGGLRGRPGRSPVQATGRGGAESDGGEDDAWGWLSDDEQPGTPLAAVRASAAVKPSRPAAAPQPRLRPAGGAASASSAGCGTVGAHVAAGRLKRGVGPAGAAKTLGPKPQAQPSPAPPARATAKAASAPRPPSGVASTLRAQRTAEPQGRRAHSVEPSPARPVARRTQGTSATRPHLRPSSSRPTPEASPHVGGSTAGRSKAAVWTVASSSKRRL